MITEIPDTSPLSTILPTPSSSKHDDTKHFRFAYVENAKAAAFQDKFVQESLYKWGMQDHIYLKRFSYDRHVQPYEIDAFLLAFFNDPNVNPHIKVLCTGDRWGTLGKVTNIDKEQTAHTVTNLAFFDRLNEGGRILRENGDIIKCLDEYYNSFLIADELRRCLLIPESETYDIFNPKDRQEFIFHVFKALCLGGKLCQYEDEIEPYLKVTKEIYKTLLSVTKDQQTKKLRVASLVFKINAVESSVSPLFPIEHPQNFCYVSIDPIKRNVHLFYHASDTYY